MPIFRLPLAGRFPAVSAYYSMAYMVMFLPLTLIVYSIAPRKLRKYALLLASYGFYWLVSGELLAVLLLETLSIFAFGKWLGALGARRVWGRGNVTACGQSLRTISLKRRQRRKSSALT